MLLKNKIAEHYSQKDSLIDTDKYQAVIFGWEKACQVLELEAQAFGKEVKELVGKSETHAESGKDASAALLDDKAKELGRAFNLLMDAAKRINTMEYEDKNVAN